MQDIEFNSSDYLEQQGLCLHHAYAFILGSLVPICYRDLLHLRLWSSLHSSSPCQVHHIYLHIQYEINEYNTLFTKYIPLPFFMFCF